MKKNICISLLLLFAFATILSGCNKDKIDEDIKALDTPTQVPAPTLMPVSSSPISFVFLEGEKHTYNSLYHQLTFFSMQSKGYNASSVYVDENQDLTGIFSQIALEGSEYVIVTSNKLNEQIKNFQQFNTTNMVFMQNDNFFITDIGLSYGIKLYEYYYLAGIALAQESDTKTAGFVANIPNAETIRCINAFALGMKSVDDNAMVIVSWTDNYTNENGIFQTLDGLLNQSCDVFAYNMPGNLVEKVSSNTGNYHMSLSTNAVFGTNEKLVIKPTINLINYYTSILASDKSILPLEFSYLGIANDIISYEIAPSLTEAKQLVQSSYGNIASGYEIFTGPIYNEFGQIVPENTVLPQSDIWSMLWFIDNVVGDLPAG